MAEIKYFFHIRQGQVWEKGWKKHLVSLGEEADSSSGGILHMLS